MSNALRRPRMTQEEFLDWVATQDEPWEFDGFEPVPKFGIDANGMVGATLDHVRISENIRFALRSRLRGGPCEVMGSDAGVAIPERSVRYPDALVTCTRGPGTDRLVPGVVVAFEVLSPSTSRTDRIVKLREYGAVPSIRRYVILEHASAALTLFARTDAGGPWLATPLTEEDILPLPEIGIEVPVVELYEGVAFDPPPPGGSA
jgi:Uma2 family endonuclease